MQKIAHAVVAIVFSCLPSMVWAADRPVGTLQCAVPARLVDPGIAAECSFSPSGGAAIDYYTATFTIDAGTIAPASGNVERTRAVILWSVYGPERASSLAVGALSGAYRTTPRGNELQGTLLRLKPVREPAASQRVNLAGAVPALVLRAHPHPANLGIAPQPSPHLIEDFFPWPPPPASALTTLPKSLLGDHKRFQHVADVAEFLEQTLAKAGFDQWGYFSLPDEPAGFGLVSRLEQFNPNTGASLAGTGRWSMELAGARDIPIWRALFLLHRAVGHYRLFVFVLSAKPTADQSSAKPATMELAQWWTNKGRRFLPDEIGRNNLTPSHRLVVRVYEFNQADKGPSELVQHSSFSASDHLKAAAIHF